MNKDLLKICGFYTTYCLHHSFIHGIVVIGFLPLSFLMVHFDFSDMSTTIKVLRID